MRNARNAPLKTVHPAVQLGRSRSKPPAQAFKDALVRSAQAIDRLRKSVGRSVDQIEVKLDSTGATFVIMALGLQRSKRNLLSDALLQISGVETRYRPGPEINFIGTSPKYFTPDAKAILPKESVTALLFHGPEDHAPRTSAIGQGKVIELMKHITLAGALRLQDLKEGAQTQAKSSLVVFLIAPKGDEEIAAKTVRLANQSGVRLRSEPESCGKVAEHLCSAISPDLSIVRFIGA